VGPGVKQTIRRRRGFSFVFISLLFVFSFVKRAGEFSFVFISLLFVFIFIRASIAALFSIDATPPWHMVWPFRILPPTCASLQAEHAALCRLSALISFRMPREMMLGMVEIDFGERARDSSRGDAFHHAAARCWMRN
jgi:hypothetical protein